MLNFANVHLLYLLYIFPLTFIMYFFDRSTVARFMFIALMQIHIILYSSLHFLHIIAFPFSLFLHSLFMNHKNERYKNYFFYCTIIPEFSCIAQSTFKVLVAASVYERRYFGKAWLCSHSFLTMYVLSIIIIFFWGGKRWALLYVCYYAIKRENISTEILTIITDSIK